MNTLYNKEKPKLKKKKEKVYRLTKIRPTLIDGFIYVVIDGRVAKRYPYLHFYSRDAAGMMIERKKKKGPISKEKTNTHSKKPHDLSNWAIYFDHHGVIQCISEAWNETYQRGVEGWRVCPQGHVALGAVGTGTVDGVCEGRDPGVGAEQTRPVLAGTHRLSRVGVRHYGPTILTTWGGRWR